LEKASTRFHNAAWAEQSLHISFTLIVCFDLLICGFFSFKDYEQCSSLSGINNK